MPRASFNPDKAKQGSSGIENGNYLVTAAKVANVEGFGKVVQPALVFTAELLDKDGDVVRDADSVNMQFAFGPESAKRFSPGTGTSMTDIDPTDLGKEIDTEGNTLYCDEGAQLNASAAGTVFSSHSASGDSRSISLRLRGHRRLSGSSSGLRLCPARTSTHSSGCGSTKDPVRRATCSPTKSRPNGSTLTTWARTARANRTRRPKPSPTKPIPSRSAPTDVLKACVERLAKLKSGKGPIPTRMSANGFLKNEFSRTGGPGKTSGMTLPEFNKILADDELVKTALMDVGAELGLDDNGEWTGAVTFA